MFRLNAMAILNAAAHAGSPDCGGSGRRSAPGVRFRAAVRLVLGLLAALGGAHMEATGAPDGAVRDDESVLLQPGLATAVPGGWRVELEGVLFEPPGAPRTLAELARWAGLEPDGLTPVEQRVFEERIERFFVDHERGRRLEFRVPGLAEPVRASRSGADGRFAATLTLPSGAFPRAGVGPDGGVWFGSLLVATGGRRGGSEGQRAVPWTVHFVGPEGWSVISDIDDTIKVSHVRDKKALLRATFAKAFEPVPGMASIYRRWAEAGARFHYVSASPWQLQPPLEAFRAASGFPAGTYHLKRFRPKEASSLLNMLGDQHQYKLANIGTILKAFPRRRFVLVGDSGEQDPEIYGELARRHPGQIAFIRIRNVTGEGAGHPRHARAFRGVPASVWGVFDDASELDQVPVPAR